MSAIVDLQQMELRAILYLCIIGMKIARNDEIIDGSRLFRYIIIVRCRLRLEKLKKDLI